MIGLLAVILIPLVVAQARNFKDRKKKKLYFEDLKDKLNNYTTELQGHILDKKKWKLYLKDLKKKKAKEAKTTVPKSYVLEFIGDKMASQTDNLREEISLILKIAKPEDEVIVLLESRGGSVAHYGLAASQLKRLRDHGISLTICVDKVAASGGYLMACVGNKILSAPFAFVGSIGVLYGIPNIHDLLKKNLITYEELTAGKYKRTLTPFSKVTEEKKEKLQEQINLVHEQFQSFLKQYRTDLDFDKVATGEAWLGEEALKLGLVDGIQCGDDYIMGRFKTRDVYKVALKKDDSLLDKVFGKVMSFSLKDKISGKVYDEMTL
ncbi:MAG: protease SohB [Bdellovibrionales bacterium]|nr:protease SohB [Bdellovibrionales bacterium]